MNIRSHLCILIIAIFLSNRAFGQKERISDYYKIKLKYENRLENDSTALPLIRTFVQKAKNEKSYVQLLQGYKDAIHYSSSPDDKLRYADSAIWASKLTDDDSAIGKAYLTKGTVYYFNFKKYKLALDQLLVAYDYSKNIDDAYYQNKVSYLLGVLKSYIGFYEEALTLFRQTTIFFEKESGKDMHPNLLYGNKRGYFNSLHQMAICYRNLGNIKMADSLTEVGIDLTDSGKDYLQERGYFLKEKGIGLFCKKDYRNAIESLKGSVEAISSVSDFAWTSVCYSYIGKSYMELGEETLAMKYFQKVDSIFNKHNFILPEVRNIYELLITYYKEKGHDKKELYYTTQLLRADKVITRDFTYLSSRIHREYDAKRLIEGKYVLERKFTVAMWITRIFAIFAVIFFIALVIRYRKEQIILEKYKRLEKKIVNGHDGPGMAKTIKDGGNTRPEVDQKKLEEILVKLDRFEKNHGFRESGLSVVKLAAKLDTNQTYLSMAINEYKGVNFTRYLSELRIAYITDKLYNDKRYLKYTIDTLAEECGIASRNNFSDLFKDINGIRPTDFIKKRLEDTGSESDS